VPAQLLTTASGNNERDAQDAKTDKDKLQGKWVFVSGQDGGKEAQGDEAERLK
jgi:hypothetical protein